MGNPSSPPSCRSSRNKSRRAGRPRCTVLTAVLQNGKTARRVVAPYQIHKERKRRKPEGGRPHRAVPTKGEKKKFHPQAAKRPSKVTPSADFAGSSPVKGELFCLGGELFVPPRGLGPTAPKGALSGDGGTAEPSTTMERQRKERGNPSLHHPRLWENQKFGLIGAPVNGGPGVSGPMGTKCPSAASPGDPLVSFPSRGKKLAPQGETLPRTAQVCRSHGSFAKRENGAPGRRALPNTQGEKGKETGERSPASLHRYLCCYRVISSK